MARRCKVYLLIDPRTGEKKYIGQTRCHERTRLKFHYKEMRRAEFQKRSLRPVHAWLLELANAGFKPTIEILDDNGLWDIAEAVWIDRLTNEGCQLLNRAARFM
jgi:hypothetical protein